MIVNVERTRRSGCERQKMRRTRGYGRGSAAHWGRGLTEKRRGGYETGKADGEAEAGRMEEEGGRAAEWRRW